MHSNSGYNKNTNKYRKFDTEEGYDKKPKRNTFKKRTNKREDPVYRYRNGHET